MDLSAIDAEVQAALAAEEDCEAGAPEWAVNPAWKTDEVYPKDHPKTADAFLWRWYTHDDGQTLVWWQGTFWQWRTTHWVPLERGAIENEVWRWLGTYCYYMVVTSNGSRMVRAAPNTGWISQIMAGIRAAAERPAAATFGWDGADGPAQPVSVENGILCLDTVTLRHHTPRLFNGVHIAAPWLQEDENGRGDFFRNWVRDAVGDEQEVLLQEVVGYLVSGDTRAQKAFMIYGAPRSGKGTLLRILSRLMGGDVATMSFPQLQQQFGLEHLIGKTVAVFPDVRVGRNTDFETVAERILSVSGEDEQVVQQKFKSPWTGALGVRFLMVSNAMIGLHDTEAALATRFVYIETLHSHLGKEDVGLFPTLWADRADILRWAVIGYQRLKARNLTFFPTQQNRDAGGVAQFHQAPVKTFVSRFIEFTGDKDDRLSMQEIKTVFDNYAEEQDVIGFTSRGFGKKFWSAVRGRAERCKMGHLSALRGASGVRWNRDIEDYKEERYGQI